MNDLDLMISAEALLVDYARRIMSEDEFNKKIPLVYYLFNKGVNNSLFTGTYNPNRLPDLRKNNTDTPAINKLFDIKSIEPDLIANQYPNGDLTGPFKSKKNFNEPPYVPRNFAPVIERADGKFFTYGFAEHAKAILMYYGDNPLDTKDRNILDYLKAWDDNGNLIDFTTIDFGKEEGVLESKINGFYNGHAGELEGESTTCNDEGTHDITIRQPLMQVITKDKEHILFMDNIVYKTTTKLNTKKFGAREYKDDRGELDKYAITTIIALKKGTKYSTSLGHNIGINIPENQPIDETDGMQGIDNLETEEGNLTIQTMFGKAESPFLPRQTYVEQDGRILADADKLQINEIFCRAIGEAVYSIYVKKKPYRQVDYEMISKYGSLLLSPNLEWHLINNQKTMPERFYRAGEISGAMIKGTLITPGTDNPLTKPIYNVNPRPFEANIDTPPPVGRILVNNGDADFESIITYIPNRDYKVHKCWELNNNKNFKRYQFYKEGNIYTTCFGGYCKKGYMPELITETKELIDKTYNFNGNEIKIKIDNCAIPNIPSNLFTDLTICKGQFNPDFYENPEKYLPFFYPLNTLSVPENIPKNERVAWTNKVLDYINFFKPKYLDVKTIKSLNKKIEWELNKLQNRERIKL